MGFDTATIKPWLLETFSDCITKHVDHATALSDIHMNRPIVIILDAAQRLESALSGIGESKAPGNTLFAKINSGVDGWLKNPCVAGVVFTFDSHYSIPTKEIDERRSYRGPLPSCEGFEVNNVLCPDHKEWSARKANPTCRKTMYSFITRKFEEFFDRTKVPGPKQITGEKFLIVSSAVDEGTEHEENPYKTKKHDYSTGWTSYEENHDVCEGELAVLWHMKKLGPQYDYILVSSDGDLVPLSILHAGDATNKIYISQPNYEDDKGDLKQILLDVKKMQIRVTESMFNGLVNKNPLINMKLVWFVAMMISGGNDFVKGYCKGVGFSDKAKGWMLCANNPTFSDMITVSTDTTAHELPEISIDPIMMRKLTETIYKSKKKTPIKHSDYMGNAAKLLNTDIFCGNLAWCLQYWCNQINYTTNRQVLRFTGTELCSTTNKPIFGYVRASDRVQRADDISFRHTTVFPDVPVPEPKRKKQKK